MRILLAGGAGFIGSHTAELLEQRRHDVMVVDDFSTGRSENLANFNGKIKPCDINDTHYLERCFEEHRPEAVIHLAAQSAISTAWNNPKHDLRVNGVGTLNLLELSMKFNVSKFIYSSTSAVYSDRRKIFELMKNENKPCEPSTPYGISKLCAENYIRSIFPNHVILRYGNVYGPRQVAIGENQVVARAFNHFVTGENFTVHGNGNQRRDFVFVEDIAHANFLALMTTHTGTFNCASGRSHSINDVLSMIEEIYDVVGYKWEHDENHDKRENVFMDASKIKNEFGWTARMPLKEGLKKTAAWWEGRK